MAIASGTSGADSTAGASFWAPASTEPARTEAKISKIHPAVVRACQRQGIISIPQGLSRLQRVLNSFLRLAFAAKGFETLALQIEDVLLGDGSARSNIAAAKNLCDLSSKLHLVVGDEVPLPHE